METQYLEIEDERKISSGRSIFASIAAGVGIGAVLCLLYAAFSHSVPELSLPFMSTTRSAFRTPIVSRPSMDVRAAPSFGRVGLSGVVSGSFTRLPTVLPGVPDADDDLLVVHNAKRSLGSTIERGTNIKRRLVSGYRARRATPGGRRVLKSRRAKGRHVLVPASLRKRCKGGMHSKSTGKSFPVSRMK
ncbi:hypothetical protein AAMO2058_000552500 [Amorphochlora amoebiformis]|eukprot:1316194-Amorphochlora_amoeboformis.AAC.1